MSSDHSEKPPGKLTINGIEPAVDNLNHILELLRSCPHGVEERHRVHTPINYASAPGKGWDIEQAAYRVDYSNDPDNLSLRQKRIDLYLQAADAFRQEDQLLAEANTLSLAALEWMDYPKDRDSSGAVVSEKAVKLFQKASAIHERLGNYDHLYRDTERLYTTALRTVRAYRESGDDKAAEIYYALAREAMQNLPHIAATMQGPADRAAYLIGEGEIGYSNGEPIGTSNTSQCLVLIVQPNHAPEKRLKDSVVESNLTGIVHVDHETDLSTLNKFFAPFPPGPISVRVVGARFQNDPIAYENIHRIIRALAQTGRDINIISADVEGGDKGPSAVVVRPKTFGLEEAVPAQEDPNQDITNALPLFYKRGRPLTVAIDLAKSHEYAPVLLDRERVAMLRNDYLGRDLVGINDSMLKSPHIIDDYGLSAHYIDGLCKAYTQSYEALEKALERRISKVRKEHSDCSEKLFETARDLLRAVPLYVGMNAEKANKPVLDAIEHLFELDSGRVKLCPESLINLELSPHSYEALFSSSLQKLAERPRGGGTGKLR